MPQAPVTDLIPFVHVADIERSVIFYGLLGMEADACFEQDGWLLWCSMRSRQAQIMLTLAGEPIDPAQQAILFYLYTDDLQILRDELIEAGVSAGPIEDGTPGPKREMRVADPDGYVLMVAENGRP